MQAVLDDYVQRGEAAGVVAVAFGPENIVTSNTAGWNDLASKQPVAGDSLFWIASMTKPITAMAILNLRDEGRLTLEDPVARHLPEFGAENSHVKPVTIRHLLTHTSGLADKPAETKPKTLAELVALYPAQPPRFAPGAKWEYCNSGINTLGRIVEVLSGQPFSDYLAEHFFQPLGMKDTTFHPDAAQARRLARTYKKGANGALEATGIAILLGGAVVPPADSIPYPAGGLFSTADDLVPFYQMVLRGGEAGGRRYVKKETLQEMAALQSGELTTGFTPGASWGLGWGRVAEPQGITAALSPGSFGHGGAYGTQIWLDPVKGRGYLLLLQRADIGNSDGSEVRRDFQNAAAALEP